MKKHFRARSPWILLLLGILLRPACGGGGGGGSTPPPPAPFAVNFSKPGAAPAAPRQPVVYVRFNQDFNQATVVDGTSFTVSDGVTTVPGTLTFVHANHEIQWVPNAALAASTLHTVTLSVAITNISASPLAAPFSFSFTTGSGSDIVRPTFAGAATAVNPAKNAIDLTWAAATDASAITYEIFLSTTSGLYDMTTPYTTVAAPSTGTTVTGLASNTTFYFRVRARDADGNTDLNVAEVTNKTLVSFSVDVYNGIVQSNCRTCHTTGQGSTDVPSMNYTSAATTYTSWYNQAIATVPGRTCLPGEPHAGAVRVKPGGGAAAIADSFLYNKVKSKHDGVAPWCGVGMPFTGGALSTADVQTIYDWIFQGAPNN